MKNLNTLKLPDDLASPVQDFIYNTVISVELLLVFYTPIANSKLKVLTLVVDKQNHVAIVSVLQPQIEALNPLINYDTLISINYHTVSSKDSHFHFSFLQLHLQPCFVIYSNDPKRWNSLFQNFYVTDKQKAKVLFKNYSKDIENRVKEAISIFVKPLVKQQAYQAAHIALLEVFSYYYELLKNLLLPKSIHHKFSEQEFKSFLDLYYSEFSKILNQISKIKALSFNDQSQYILGETQEYIFDKIKNRALELQTTGVKQLNLFYTKRLDLQLIDTVTEETLLLKQLITFLNNCYKIDAIYLLNTNSFCNATGNCVYKFNLLLIAPTLRIQQHDVVVQKVSNYFKGKVQVFCLIHTLEWFQKSQNKFQVFFKKFIVPQNLLYLKKNLTFSQNLLESQNTSYSKQLQKQYVNERRNYISPWFTAFQQGNLVYQRGHILLLKNMLQHLILGLLYQKVQYVPAMYSLRYLMQLFEAFLPEIYRESVDLNDVQTILELLSTPIDFLPKSECGRDDINKIAYAKALCLCEKLYNQAQWE